MDDRIVNEEQEELEQSKSEELPPEPKEEDNSPPFTEEEMKEDYDFDFSMYEDENEEHEVINSLHEDNLPQIMAVRSRYSLGIQEIERIAELKIILTKYSIKVSSRTQDIPTLWKMYGILDEMWSTIEWMHGKYLHGEMNEIKKRCKHLLETYRNGQIPPKVHNNLLYFKKQIYRLLHFGNLGLECDKINKHFLNRTKRKIVE